MLGGTLRQRAGVIAGHRFYRRITTSERGFRRTSVQMTGPSLNASAELARVASGAPFGFFVDSAGTARTTGELTCDGIKLASKAATSVKDKQLIPSMPSAGCKRRGEINLSSPTVRLASNGVIYYVKAGLERTGLYGEQLVAFGVPIGRFEPGLGYMSTGDFISNMTEIAEDEDESIHGVRGSQYGAVLVYVRSCE
eukprot:2309951-Amphidinium_carterae.1